MRRGEFPILDDEIVYLDSACMSLKPRSVIEKVEEYYREYPACSGRSSHSVSRRAQEELESARRKVASFIDAPEDNLVFTSGTTESINTVARGLDFDRVFLTDKEHNSNREVWEELGAEIIEMKGLDKSYLASEINENDLLSILHVSNLDGEEFDIESACRIAHENDAFSLVDAAQSIPHTNFSVQDYRADFVAFSGHKMLGPTGTGALYVSDRVKDKLEPLKYGGGAVRGTENGETVMEKFPKNFEPGLRNIAGFTGFGAAAEYLESVGMQEIERHESRLTEMMVDGLEELGFEVINRGPGIVSIPTESMSPGEVAEILDRRGIKIRAGQHCVHRWFGKQEFDATLRASLYLYNQESDIRKFLNLMEKISRL